MRFLTALTLLSANAYAGDFVDTRLSFTLGDDDFLHDAGETSPSSPRIGFGDRPGYELFFDNLNRRTTGRENELHLVLWKKVEGFIPRLSTEAAAAIEIDMGEMATDSPKVSRVFEDDSSYLRVAYALEPGETEIVMFPFSTDRFRLGYLYDLTWGGDAIFPGKSGPAPGLKLGLNRQRWYAFGGLKTAQILTREPFGEQKSGEAISGGDLQTFYGVLGGMGLRLGSVLGDLGLGYFQMGQSPVTDVLGEPVATLGGSGRLAWARGMPIGLSADLKLFRTDPEFLESLNRPESYPGGFSYSLSVEGNMLVQTLDDPDTFASTKREMAPAAAFDARARYNFWRANLTFFYRSLQFILHETPGFIPYVALPEDAEVRPEFFVAAAVDRHFPGTRLTPGLQAGVEVPASVHTVLTQRLVGANPSEVVIGEQTVVVRADGTKSILPEGKDAVPILAFKASLRWELSTMVTALFIGFVTVDENSTRLVRTENLTSERKFEDTTQVGGAAIVQARF